MRKVDLLSNAEENWLLDIGHEAYHVVDGQQRLTTFSVLMFEIIRLIQKLDENKGKSDGTLLIGYESIESIKEKYIVAERPPDNLIKTYKFGYERDNPSYKYLKHKIFEEPSGGTIDETYYTQNLMYAKKFFASNLAALHQEQGLSAIESLYKKLTLKLMFNLHEIEDDYDVFVAFETMNNRGKRLSNLELLKNRLIYLTTLYDDEQLDRQNERKLRDNINDAWKEIYYQLGRNKAHPLHDDELLRAHWTTYFQYTRRKGDDYIKFLLEKFSPKNVFDKHSIPIESEVFEPEFEEDDYLDDEYSANGEVTASLVSKLAPSEINDYVNNLKDMSEFWYYTFFPDHSKDLSAEEKEWVGKLHRLGMGYFRPLVAVVLSLGSKIDSEERVALLQEIERFIFLNFRMAGYNSSYQSSYYYNKARELSQGRTNLKVLTEDLAEKTDSSLNAITVSFMAKTAKRFENDLGFYAWRDLRYFLYEYENHLSVKNNLQKIHWQMFSKSERDKVTIEHILPQTPNKWYWQNQFRNFNDNEIKTLSGSLGNLLPLAHSINSSMQNVSFPDKKNARHKGRGYVNGSHSEIEVAQEKDWTAEAILKRGLKLLKFLETRWKLNFTDEQKHALLNISFVNDGRDEKPELPKPTLDLDGIFDGVEFVADASLSDAQNERLKFWTYFVKYCRSIGRGNDIASQSPSYSLYYDVTIGKGEYYVFFQVLKKPGLRIGILFYQEDSLKRIKFQKVKFEEIYGSALEWNVSRDSSVSKRITHEIDTDVFDPDSYKQNFDWLIKQFDRLKNALDEVDTDN